MNKISIITFVASVLMSTVLVGQTVPGRLHVPDVSGEYYDYTVTGKPERPYMIDYENTIMMKFFMSGPRMDKTPSGKVYPADCYITQNFETVLNNIRKIDAISRGMNKIVYLVGWQYNGHDDGYPAFFSFNEKLKRQEDATARDSYLYVQKVAKEQYNTNVSVHINVNDAYYSSPLWDLYAEKDLLSRNNDGSYYNNGKLLGMPHNKVSLCREWEAGYTAWRIDEVTEVCNLKYVNTVHLDAFQPHPNRIHGLTKEDEQVAMRKLIRYWRNLGVDVTTEFWQGFSRMDRFIGLSPACWWNNFTIKDRLEISPELACCGEAGTWEKGGDWNHIGFLFGEAQHAETYINSDSNFQKFKHEFCTMSLQYAYLNSHDIEKWDEKNQILTYSDGLVVDWPRKLVTKNGVLVRRGNDVFMPAVWIKDHREIIAYSEEGYDSLTWALPSDWKKVKTVTVYDVDENGLFGKRQMKIHEGRLTISMKPGQMLSIQAD